MKKHVMTVVALVLLAVVAFAVSYVDFGTNDESDTSMDYLEVFLHDTNPKCRRVRVQNI